MLLAPLGLACHKLLLSLFRRETMKYLLLTLLISTRAFSYEGSSASSVWNEIKKEEYETFTDKKITLSSFFVAGVKNLLEASAKRTVATKEDIIPYFDKLLHPNGICLRGKWEITEDSKYSGYFRQGSEAIIIARASTTISNTKRGSFRGFGLAGKVFPTTNEDEVVKTANFFQIDNLIGTYAKRYADVMMTNEPSVTPPVSLGLLPLVRIAAEVAKSLPKADENPGLRQVYSVSMLGGEESVVTPKYLATQVTAADIKNNRRDFRDEIVEHIEANSEITFDIKVSDDKENWQTIGRIRFDEAVASSGCDHRLHFHHHKLKKEQL